jgi:hypothetical protein
LIVFGLCLVLVTLGLAWVLLPWLGRNELLGIVLVLDMIFLVLILFMICYTLYTATALWVLLVAALSLVLGH